MAIHTSGSEDPWNRSFQWYEKNPEKYFNGCHHLSTDYFMDPFIERLKNSGFSAPKVLDAGCGTGRDIGRMAWRGARVGGFDASSAMVALSASTTGLPIAGDKMQNANRPGLVRRLTFERFNDAPGSWDGIWSIASLLHLPEEKILNAITRLILSLSNNGAIMISMKSPHEGYITSSVDSIGRPFTLLSLDALYDLVQKGAALAESRIFDVDVEPCVRKGSNGEEHSWSTITCSVSKYSH